MHYKTYWIHDPDMGKVASAVDKHLADKPPTSIVAINFSTTAAWGGQGLVHSAAVTIRYA
jgi:hypothetical protein